MASRNTKHGLADKIPEYAIWSGMIRRCRDPRSISYPHYGGRGITVDPVWQNFQRFLSDMGRRPSALHSIERIDNDGPYAPDNCRWATVSEQARNRRSNTLLTHDDVTMTLTEWAESTGVKASTIHMRLKAGWPVARALTEPLRLYHRRVTSPPGI
jgi:hypothetical protein